MPSWPWNPCNGPQPGAWPLLPSVTSGKAGAKSAKSGRGSSAFSAAVDIIVSIRRAEGNTKPAVRVLHTLSRFSETPDTLVIELTDAGYLALGTTGTVAVAVEVSAATQINRCGRNGEAD